MAKALANIRVYGDESGGAYVAPKGTTGPTDLAAPGATYKEVGWMSEDGISAERNQDATSFKAWQGGKIVRRKITHTEDAFKFQCLEENAVVFGLMYRGQTPTVTTGVASITVTNQTVSDERAWVFDVIDGSVTKRYVVPSGVAQLTASVDHKNTDMTVHEFTVTAQGDYFVLTNNPAVTGP